MDHLNHMKGVSYYPENPLIELEMMLYSSFLGQSSYYNPATDKELTKKDFNCCDNLDIIENTLKEYLTFPEHGRKSRQRIFFETANKAFDYDFGETLKLAVKARRIFLMRKSACELIAIGAAHQKRVEFNKENPEFFRNIVREVCMIPTDMISILDSWKSLKGSKSQFPSFLDRAFRSILRELKPYHVNKYRRACIDATRISHPKFTSILNELMKTGKVEVEEKDLTWETLMCKYGCWRKTLDTLEWNMPHMAALRNMRGFAIKVRDTELIQKYCDMLEAGVENGKQFPFQYLTAYESVIAETKSFSNKKTQQTYYKKGIRKSDIEIIKKCLENCIQKSIQNHPKLEGDVIVLSDNSGSAWGTCTSKYGERKIAEIGNLSALITGLSCSGRATIGLFGDDLLEYEVDKNLSFFENYNKIKEIIGKEGSNVGKATENGIWLFFKRAMKEPQKYRYDHFFCYSDQQAGHGGLYGCDPEMGEDWRWKKYYRDSNFIHIPKLIENYRKTINSKLNVFTVQTAGYNDSILPQSLGRYYILSGWTGNEVVFAEKMIQLWDKDEVQDQIQVQDQIKDQIQIKNQIQNQIEDQIQDQIKDQIQNQIENQIRNQIRDQIQNQIENQIRNQIRDEIRDQIEDQIWSEK